MVMVKWMEIRSGSVTALAGGEDRGRMTSA